VARRQIFDGLGQEEPVFVLLEGLAHVPDDVLSVIVGFMRLLNNTFLKLISASVSVL